MGFDVNDFGGGKNAGAGNVIYPVPADFSDSLASFPVTIAGLQAYAKNGFAVLRLQASIGCRWLNLFIVNNAYGTTSAAVGVSVWVDGAFLAQVEPTEVSAINTYRVALDGAAHVVEIVEGYTQFLTQGGFVYAVSSEGGPVATLPNPSVSRRLVVYGDSIGHGHAASPPTQNGWGGLIRATYPGRVSVEGWRSLYDDTGQAGAVGIGSIAALAQRLCGLFFGATICDLWDEISFNDYYPGNHQWSAADYGAALGQLYDTIHAIHPSAHIYSQTAIVTTYSGTNGFGNVLDDYRAQKIAVSAARPGWVTTVDGTALMTTAGLSADTIHPSTAGHATLAASIRAVLGY